MSEESSRIQKCKRNYYKHSKLWTLRKLVYTFTLRYSLANRAFPKATISVVCTAFPVGLQFHFSQWIIRFSQFIFIDKYLKSKEIEYFIHYIKFEMWLVLFYLNSFFFQQWNSNWDIVFFNSPLDSKWRFLNVGLRHTYFNFFPNSQKENLNLLMLV